jgi:ABC-type branched-subunit amino acid transport system ATPase component
MDTNSTSALPRDRVEQGCALVQIDKVTKSFGYKVALNNVSFSVPTGQICGLLGPNGAGKTTLFRLLMGILKATEGRLVIATAVTPLRIELQLNGSLASSRTNRCFIPTFPGGRFSN